jgi:hypothetical protein
LTIFAGEDAFSLALLGIEITISDVMQTAAELNHLPADDNAGFFAKFSLVVCLDTASWSIRLVW